MSADRSPVEGRACLTLSIFTASTGPSAGTGSPVNGDSSAPLRGGDADGGAGDAVSATISPTVRARAAPPANTLIAITRRRGVMTQSSPETHFVYQAVSAEQLPAGALGGRPVIIKGVASRSRFTLDEARAAGERIGVDWGSAPFDVEQFRMGMDVELEHGTRDPQTNVTDDDATMTAKIARAHLNEFPDYYTRLAKMEAEAEADRSE